jgi:hypothetical protein
MLTVFAVDQVKYWRGLLRGWLPSLPAVQYARDPSFDITTLQLLAS